LPLLTLDVHLIYGYVFSLGLHSFLYTNSFVVFFISSDTVSCLARRLLSKRGSNNQTIMIISCHSLAYLNLLGTKGYAAAAAAAAAHIMPLYLLILRQCTTMIITCHIPFVFCLGCLSLNLLMHFPCLRQCRYCFTVLLYPSAS
jgi:hypothetical protein